VLPFKGAVSFTKVTDTAFAIGTPENIIQLRRRHELDHLFGVSGTSAEYFPGKMIEGNGLLIVDP